MIEIPGYTLVEVVYEGAETAVYRGRRDADGVPVAVKATRSDFPTARAIARLERERAILEDLRGVPGVVRAYSLERCGRGLALVMEDLGPRSLHDRLHEGRPDIGATLRIGASLARTLEAIHALRVIHKDIKPHNIMMDAQTGEPRLIDFGIAARLSQESQKAVSPAALEGTLAYIAPEQTGRMHRVVDLRADLYSLGVTLYELLTGAPPFPGSDPTELIHGHIARVPAPPHERAREVPAALSEVVMRLLAKTPEDRYQSAPGLGADLAECLSEWEATGNIAPFQLGQKDWTGELRVPQRLYGRDQEASALLAAFERARKGAPELVLVSGDAGVGKSALVSELHKPITRQGGFFVTGKFDQISRDVPLAPLVSALRELCRHVLAEPEGALLAWKGRLLDAVGPNGRLLIDLVPELEIIIGPQPEVAALGPAQARNRFGLLIQRFLRAFAAAERPLAVFLDDLQWADAASLDLLGLLVADPEGRHLLIVGAYRKGEIDAAHPLRRALDDLREGGAAVSELSLGALDAPTVTQIVADTLGARARDVLPLAAVVAEKTGGNPFFLGQFLATLHERGLLRFNPRSGTWDWELRSVQQALATDNVVDFLVARLKRLAPATRRALELAACIGHEFDLRTLSILGERRLAEMASDLWPALGEGHVVPLGGDYRLLDESAGKAPDDADFNASYRFLHDRVLHAAYSLIDPERREEAHLRIGRLLRARSGEVPRDEDLLDIVWQLNLGARRVEDEAERIDIARLDLLAGRKAKARTAYHTAAGYLRAGIDLAGEAGWERDRELCYALAIEAAECTYLSGEPERAEAMFSGLLPRAGSALEKARIHLLRLKLFVTLAKHADAAAAGQEGLALLGVTLPDTPEAVQAAFGAELGQAMSGLGDRRVEDLAHAPDMVEPERRALLHLLTEIAMPMYYVNPGLYGVAVLKGVNISLRHGHSEESAFSYTAYGFMLSVILGQPALGHAFGRLAIALNERYQSAALSAKQDGVFANCLYVSEPLRAALPYLARAQKAALESGDFVYLSMTTQSVPPIKFGAGYQIEELRGDIEKGLALVQRTRDVTGTAVLTLFRQVIANLTGETLSRDSLSGEGFDEADFLAKLDERNHGIALLYHRVMKLQIHYLRGDLEAALQAAEEAARWSASAMGVYLATRLSLYSCLTRIALSARTDDVEERRRHRDAAARDRAVIAGLAESAPMNFKHQLLLIEAEEARAAGRQNEATELFDRAIALAQQHEYPQDEALGNELCGRLYLEMRRPKAARAYLGDAYLGYRHWGATSLAEDLAERHAKVAPDMKSGRRGSSQESSSVTNTTLLGQTVGSLRDAALFIRATQAIAGEIELPRVIERLVKVVIESSGAQRGALILERAGQLFVEATFGKEPDSLALGPSAAIDTRADLAQSLILYVARTGEIVAVDDAFTDVRFAGDPHVAAARPRSLLCIPLVHQGRLTGALYLENGDAAGAFHEARIELLGLLSSQAAIAVENARLVGGVREANEETRRLNERLEAEVAQRTDELRRSNEDLIATNRRLAVELSERERAERDRAALQEQMIDAQQARLAELSTPLIPITRRIMVMPLIGTVDSQRAAAVLEAALDGAQRQGARVVILDITGMKHIDTSVAGTLARTARALGLLGTEAVLTGVRPDVARAMVELGVDLESMVTRGTLESGFAYALERSGESRLLGRIGRSGGA